MSELVLPPWDLCGFDNFDPYSWPWERSFTVRWAWNGGPLAPAEMSVEPVRDPNEADGRWRELAFMPYVEERIVYRAKWAEVPGYLSVLSALVREQVLRRSGARSPAADCPISCVSSLGDGECDADAVGASGVDRVACG